VAPRWRELAKLGWGSPHRPIDGESNLCLGLAFSAVGFGLGGVLFVLTPYLQIVQGNDALATGVRLLPQMAGFMVGAGAGQRLLSSFGTKVTVAGGLFVTAAGVLLLSQANAATSYAVIAAALSVVGLGMGSAMPSRWMPFSALCLRAGRGWTRDHPNPAADGRVIRDRHPGQRPQ
jgi:hypothetical protein